MNRSETLELPGAMERAAAPRAGEASGSTRSAFWTVAFSLFAISTAVGLLGFGYKYLDDIVRAKPGELLVKLIEEMTGAYTGLLVIPFVIWLARRFPLRFDSWPRVIPYHLAGVVAFSAALTTLRYVSRLMVFWSLGLGEYDYGIMHFRYLMEFPNDTVWYCLIVGFTQAYVRLREAREREVRQAHLEAGLAEARLQALGAQLHPHFLFNTLNAISSAIYENPRAADEMVAKLSDLLRATLRAPERSEATVDEELRYLDLYLDLMRARFEERLATSLNVDPAARDACIPFLLLQPLVENAIHHGADLETKTVTVDLTIARDRDVVTIRIQDRGPGLSGASHPGHGVGLANTRERLAWLYGDSASLALESGETGGLLVTIRVPYHTEPVAAAARPSGLETGR